MDSKSISRYHVIVIALYSLVVCLFFITRKPSKYYSFIPSDLTLFFIVFLLALITLIIANKIIKFGRIGLNKTNLCMLVPIIIYALILFAFPEEIIFRGIIQNWMYNLIGPFIAVLLSSIVFGAAHALNGARGFLPKKWDWKLMAMTSIAGVYLSVAYYITGSLVVPTLLHAMLIVAMKLFVKE